MNFGVYFLQSLIIFAGAYLIGSIPFGYLIGKIHGIDIREHGSGNIGATNVTRVIGSKTGKLCFFLDFVKGFLPVFSTLYLTESAHLLEDPVRILPAIAAFAVVTGHIWPIYLKFKGGKGVSTAAGAILSLSPWAVLVGLAVWVLVFQITRYVSMASILAAAILPLTALLLNFAGISNASPAAIILFLILAILTILKHTSNIKRLMNGTENRFSGEKK